VPFPTESPALRSRKIGRRIAGALALAILAGFGVFIYLLTAIPTLKPVAGNSGHFPSSLGTNSFSLNVFTVIPAQVARSMRLSPQKSPKAPSPWIATKSAPKGTVALVDSRAQT
jgi:hypothetical protein